MDNNYPSNDISFISIYRIIDTCQYNSLSFKCLFIVQFLIARQPYQFIAFQVFWQQGEQIFTFYDIIPFLSLPLSTIFISFHMVNSCYSLHTIKSIRAIHNIKWIVSSFPFVQRKRCDAIFLFEFSSVRIYIVRFQ